MSYPFHRALFDWTFGLVSMCRKSGKRAETGEYIDIRMKIRTPLFGCVLDILKEVSGNIVTQTEHVDGTIGRVSHKINGESNAHTAHNYTTPNFTSPNCCRVSFKSPRKSVKVVVNHC